MINITGLKDHEQSRLMTHYATIKAWEDTLATEITTFANVGESIPESRVNEITHFIQNETEGIRQVIEASKNNDETPDEFIDRVLNIIQEIKKHIYVLPDDIEKTVRLILEQFEKILKFAKEIF